MGIIVGPAEMQVTDTSERILLTSSLGSGVGVAIYDSESGMGGIIHYLLPSSGHFRSRAKNRPLLFADSGIPRFLNALLDLGAKIPSFKVVVAGGSQIIGQDTPYDIARRNQLAAEGILAQNKISINYKEFGGNFYRRIRIDGGDIVVEIPGHGEKKI